MFLLEPYISSIGVLVAVGSDQCAEEKLSGSSSFLPLIINRLWNFKPSGLRLGFADSAELGRQSIQPLCLCVESLA